MKAFYCICLFLFATVALAAANTIDPNPASKAVVSAQVDKVIDQVHALGGKYLKPGTFSFTMYPGPGPIPGQPDHGFSFHGANVKEQLESFVKLNIDFPFMLALYTSTNKDTAEMLQLLAGLDNLHSLKLHGPFAADVNMVHLAKLKNLKVLELGCTPYLTKKGLEQLALFPNLQALGLYQCFKLGYNVSDLKCLGRLPKLELLYYRYTGHVCYVGHPKDWIKLHQD